MRPNHGENDLLRTDIIIPITLYSFALFFAMKLQGAAKITLQRLGSSVNVLQLHWTGNCVEDFVSLLIKKGNQFLVGLVLQGCLSCHSPYTTSACLS